MINKKILCFFLFCLLTISITMLIPPDTVFAGDDGIDVFVGALGSTDIYKSDDGGDTWELSAEAADLNNAIKIWDIEMDNDGNAYAAIENENGGEIFIYDEDEGEWTDMTAAEDLGDATTIESITMDSNDNMYAAVNCDDGSIRIYKSDDEKDNWEAVFQNDDGIVIYDLYIDAEGYVYAVIEGAGDYEGYRIIRSEDEGETWDMFALREPLDDIPCWQTTHADLLGVDSNGNIYAGTPNNEVYKREASGDTWEKVGDTGDFGASGWISSLIIDSDDNIFVARAPDWGVGTGMAAVYVSDDGGSTWDVSADTITAGSNHFNTHSPDGIEALSYDEEGSIYAVSDNPAVIYKKEDGGDWTVIVTTDTANIDAGVTGFTTICAYETDFPDAVEEEAVVTIDPDKDEEIIHELSDGTEVTIEIDAGTFDEEIDITIVECTDIPEVPASQADILESVGSAITIEFSDSSDAGTKFNKPVSIYIDAVGVDEEDADLITMASFTESTGSDLWTLLPSEYSIVDDVIRVKGETTHFTIFQLMKMSPSSVLDVKAYPNPFKPGQTGNFNAAEIMFTGLTAKFNIKIFDIAGGLVFEKSVTGSGGNYSWDAKNSAGNNTVSGVYLYVIEDTVGSNTVTGKICIIR